MVDIFGNAPGPAETQRTANFSAFLSVSEAEEHALQLAHNMFSDPAVDLALVPSNKLDGSSITYSLGTQQGVAISPVELGARYSRARGAAQAASLWYGNRTLTGLLGVAGACAIAGLVVGCLGSAPLAALLLGVASIALSAAVLVAYGARCRAQRADCVRSVNYAAELQGLLDDWVAKLAAYRAMAQPSDTPAQPGAGSIAGGSTSDGASSSGDDSSRWATPPQSPTLSRTTSQDSVDQAA
jgi:hypothetical protein